MHWRGRPPTSRHRRRLGCTASVIAVLVVSASCWAAARLSAAAAAFAARARVASRRPLAAFDLTASSISSAPLPRVVALQAAAGGGEPQTFEQKKDALKRCLAREYRSFFRPFEADFYSEDVTFRDPLNDLKGKDKYQGNVEMLSGDSLAGKVLFRDGFIDLHAVEDVPGEGRRVRTRWTLGFTFQLLPWQPQALFSGVSEYEIDSEAKVLSQRDYWDTINLERSGAYAPEALFAGLGDLGEQLLPSFLRKAEEPTPASSGRWALLRRAERYRVYRDSASGKVFAIAAPGASKADASVEALTAVLRSHSLVTGDGLLARMSGRGELLPVPTNPAAAPADAVPGVELLGPHPWEGEQPPE